MDRKTFLAITLCFLIFVAWQKYYLEPQTAQQAAYQQAQLEEQQRQQKALIPAAPSAIVSQNEKASSGLSTPPQAITQKPEIRTLVSKTGPLTVSNGAKFFSDWKLSGYKVDIAKDAATIDLRSVLHQEGEMELAFDDSSLAYLSQAMGTFRDIPNGALWTYEDSNLKITREITTTPDTPYIDVKLNAEFKGAAPKFAFISLGSQGAESDPEEQDRQLLYWTNNSIERNNLTDVSAVLPVSTPVKYIAASNRYFLFSVINQSPTEPNALIQPLGPRAGKISLVYPVQGNSVSIPVRVYFGPKDLELLRSVEPLLDHAVDFGWFTIVAYPLLKLLKWFYGFALNYGVAIIFLTIFVRLITYPLTYKSMKSMKDMARIQPQLQRIREKHKDDKEALNREMLTLMKSHGYNPMAGCLPILVQMPIFFALYRVLYGSVELYHAPFALWIHDLAAKDPLYVTPVLLSVTMYIQQKLTPNTATDPVQQKMLQFMPLIFGGFMLALPSGLTLYMLVSAVAGIVQQLILNKKLGITPNTSIASAK
ncbi:MAG TPA: hypothetical protein DCS07_10470 [Bdellovibrionales bacterium]|nr:hypothetical protein [Bdellovibrionales bacterium]HCM40722.1 hypothetical protein [Bdellovibrionales bacterium]